MISSIGHDELPVHAVAAIADLVEFEHAGVFLFRPCRPPRDLLASRLSGAHHQTYCRSTYRLDPFYKGAQGPRAAGIYRMPELDASYQAYLDRYEMGPRVADILRGRSEDRPLDGRLREEIGYLLPVGAGRFVHIALIRSTALQPFDAEEIGQLAGVGPVLQAVFERHFRSEPAGDSDDAEAASEAWPAPAMVTLAGRLTERELEMAGHILNGLRPAEMAARMAIAPGTVKVHRRNIYRKLAISSRSELITLCRAAAGKSREPRNAGSEA